MSRLSALFTARKRPDAPPVAAASTRSPSSEFKRQAQSDLEDNVFSLVSPEKSPEPPRETSQETSKDADSPARTAAGNADPAPSAKSGSTCGKTSGSTIHPLANADLSRLAIDEDGKLYWDGKPVEVRRRLSLSPEQVMAGAIVAVFLVIGALGAAAQGSLALRDWGCRLGWTTNYCGLPDKAPPRLDIPA